LNLVHVLFGFAVWTAGLFEISVAWWAQRPRLDRQSQSS
jgi:hypothetical protein